MSEVQSHSSDYVRFMILGEPRTGSTMLSQALNSHGAVRSFREIFNWRQDFVDFQVPGYDKNSKEDLAWRKRDPSGFLRERIFCEHPAEIRAVGFKFLYPHYWGFRGLVPYLVGDTELRVLHIRRRNLLRQCVSQRIAETTGVWAQGGSPAKLTLASALRAIRHPSRALAGLRRRLRRPAQMEQVPRVRVTISPEELSKFVDETALSAAHFEQLFSEHKTLPVVFEEMVDRREEVFNGALEFLDVEPQPLTVTLRRQNPEPLRELIENYDELKQACKGTRHEEFFD